MRIRSEKVYKRYRRHRRVRRKIVGTSDRPRLCVFRSARHIYVQLVDDTEGRTLGSSSSLKLPPVSDDEKAGGSRGKTAIAREVGKRIAEVAKEKGIESVCFDRGGYIFHGRVAALAEGARENGLKF